MKVLNVFLLLVSILAPVQGWSNNVLDIDNHPCNPKLLKVEVYSIFSKMKNGVDY